MASLNPLAPSFPPSKLTTSVHSQHLSPGAGIPGPSAHGSCTQNNLSAPAHRIAPLTQSFIRLGFLNVCSLRNKVAEVADILQQYNFDIFGVAETWLDSTTSNSDIDIPGYCVIRHDRPVRRGGGVCFYFRSGLQVKPRPELSDANIESSWIEVKGRRRRQLVGCFYRPPDEPICRILKSSCTGLSWTTQASQSLAILTLMFQPPTHLVLSPGNFSNFATATASLITFMLRLVSHRRAHQVQLSISFFQLVKTLVSATSCL